MEKSRRQLMKKSFINQEMSKREGRRRKRRKYPNVFFKKNLIEVFENIDNVKTMTAAFLSFFCALRISEVCSLKWQNIDLNEKRLKVVDGKNHKDGFVPISSLCIPILEKWRAMNKGQEYVFPATKEGLKYYCPHALHVDFKKALARAGLHIPTEKMINGRQQHQYKFHTLRHSRCTHLLSNGIPIQKVQKFMRHDEVETTMVYTWILDQELNTMVEEADVNIMNNILPEDSHIPTQSKHIETIEDPISITKKRLARGEISIREYKRLVGTLIASDSMQQKAPIQQKNISPTYLDSS
jgi:integrase